MISVQIDTGRSWRGGQNQVLLLTRGLRARGHRVVFVIHPDGELRKRLDGEAEVVPLAPRTEVDLPAAWRLSRLLREVGPDILHAHDSHAVAMAAAGLSFSGLSPRPPLVFARRVDFRLRGNSFSKWKYRQVDCFVAASDAIRRMLEEDGTPQERLVTVHDGIDTARVERAAPVNLREEFWFPANSVVAGNIAALVPHKGQKYLVEAAAAVIREVPEAIRTLAHRSGIRGTTIGTLACRICRTAIGALANRVCGTAVRRPGCPAHDRRLRRIYLCAGSRLAHGPWRLHGGAQRPLNRLSLGPG
jgi:glycosyltransferase involved in cell wall biosynthesis